MKPRRLLLLFLLLLAQPAVYAQRDPPTTAMELKSPLLLSVELKIPHEYRQLPGTHAWTYWDAQVQEILRIAATRLSSQEPALKASTQ